MDLDLVREVCIEYCENIYAVGSGYLINNNNSELSHLLKNIEELEDKVRICDDVNKLFNHKRVLEQIANRIEVIINA